MTNREQIQKQILRLENDLAVVDMTSYCKDKNDNYILELSFLCGRKHKINSKQDDINDFICDLRMLKNSLEYLIEDIVHEKDGDNNV